MYDILRLLSRASRRDALNRLFVSWVYSIAALCCALILLVVLDRLFSLAIPWRAIVLYGSIAAMALPLIWTALRWPTKMRLAQQLDERASLRTALSTAIAVSGDEDSWSKATVQHAAGVSKGVTLRKAMPVRVPARWPMPMVASMVLLVVYFVMPQFDLLGEQARADAEQEAAQEIASATSQAQKAKETMKATVEALGLSDDQPDYEQPTGVNADKPQSPEAIRRAAVRQLTELGDRLQTLRSGKEGMTLDAIEQQMRRLRTSRSGPLDGMVKALQQGDIQGAREQVQAIQDQLDSDELNGAQQELLKQQMKSLAEQIGKLADQQEGLKEQLRKNGIDPSMLNDPEALKQAIAQAQNMTPEQQEQLLQQMQGMQGMQDMLQQMSQAMNQAAQSMQQQGEQQGQDGQDGQQGQQQGGSAMQQLDDALAQMEMLQQEMQMLDAAQEQVWGQMSDLSDALGEDGGAGSVDMLGLWDRRKPGKGRGPGGAADGASQAAQFSLTKQKAIGQDHGGPAIATRYVQGEQIRGESTAEFREVVQSSAQQAAEAIESQRIPREYHDVIKHYFGQLESKVEAQKDSQQDEIPSDENNNDDATPDDTSDNE